jgi:hypothetical protein
MDNEIKTQLLKIETLNKELDTLKKRTDDLRYELIKEQNYLKDICIHDFIKESDGDYHKPGYYYVCKICKYLTRAPRKNS